MSTDKQITVPFTKEIDTHNCEFLYVLFLLRAPL